MDTLIICGFPGVGKTFAVENIERYKILDADSSEFSWIIPLRPDGTRNRNPYFPNNYIEHIKDNMGKYDIIFVSSHDIVRKALKESKLNYVVVIPYRNLKNHYIERLINRESNVGLIKAVLNNWDNWLSSIETIDGVFTRIYYLEYDEYLSNILDNIMNTHKYTK